MSLKAMRLRLCTLFLLFSTSFANKLPGNLIEPGRSCDPALYDQLVRPSSDALQRLYSETETEKQIAAAVSFGVSARNMQRSLHALIEVPEDEPNKGDYKKKEGNNILKANACLGNVASFLTCDAGRRACTCKNSFPFNSSLVNGECFGRPGSICAVDKSFVLPCTDGLRCEQEGIKSMRFCGGIPEYKKAQMEFLEGSSRSARKDYGPGRIPATSTNIIPGNRPGISDQSRGNTLGELTSKLEKLSQALNSNSEKLAAAFQKIKSLEDNIDSLTKRLSSEEKASDGLHRHRILLVGVPEDDRETEQDLRRRIESLVSSDDLRVQGVMCGRLQRLGIRRADGKPRAVKVNYCF